MRNLLLYILNLYTYKFALDNFIEILVLLFCSHPNHYTEWSPNIVKTKQRETSLATENISQFYFKYTEERLNILL